MITKIISGGQTGGDIGGILAAIDLELHYSGTCPAGWKNELGFDKRLMDWGFECTRVASYPPRTRINVVNSDGTIGFGNQNSRGMNLTREICRDMDKPYCAIMYTRGFHAPKIEFFVEWVKKNNIKVLNVAGNRESSNPGIQEFTRMFLVDAIQELNEK